MRKIILAAAALAAFAAVPALAMEGTFEPSVTASGFGPARGAATTTGGSFQYNNADNYGDTGMPATGHRSARSGGQISTGSFVYSMTNGQG